MYKFLIKLIIAIAIAWSAESLFFPKNSSVSASIPENGFIVNDVTGLNPIVVDFVYQPRTEQQISDAILGSTGPISIGGARYSMGGQIAYPDSLHLDMRQYNRILALDVDARRITVQPGITWREIQQAIDPHDLSVAIMQDFNNFTVGGSLSVNAHGRFAGAGPIINSVQSIRIALANGQIYRASRLENSELFYAAIGGYGGIGVITEATLELTENIPLERATRPMRFVDFLDYFKQHVLADDSVVLHNALLYPPAFENLVDITWRRTDKPLTNPGRLKTFDPDSSWKPMLVDMAARFDLVKHMRHHLFDRFMFNQPAVVYRNWETSSDLREYGFFSSASESTLALREYFVPLDNFEVFVLKMRDVFLRYGVNVLNISIRYSPRDQESLLAWAKDDMLSFVVIYHQGKDEASRRRVSEWSRELIEGAVDSGGGYYLPFQVQESTEQFFRVYPRANEFFALKNRVDPGHRFNNMLIQKHLPAKSETLPDEGLPKSATPPYAWPLYYYPYTGYPNHAHTAHHAAGRQSTTID